MMKTLWKKWCEYTVNPVWFKHMHGWLAVVWTIMIPISIVTGLIDSVAFISIISIYALMAAHFASWQSSRIEVKEDARNANL